MEGEQRTAFVSGYTKLVTTVWSDPGVNDRLVENPKAVLQEFGLGLPPSAEVSLVQQIPADGDDHSPDLDFQVRLWEEGARTGVYELHIPATPQLDTTELSEAELSQVSGGLARSGGGYYCCCCCPCCSCT